MLRFGLWCLTPLSTIFHLVISWRSVLLVEENGVPGENHRPVVSHWQTLSHNSNTKSNVWWQIIIYRKWNRVKYNFIH